MRGPAGWFWDNKANVDSSFVVLLFIFQIYSAALCDAHSIKFACSYTRNDNERCRKTTADSSRTRVVKTIFAVVLCARVRTWTGA